MSSRNLSFEVVMKKLHHNHYKQNARKLRQQKRANRHENRGKNKRRK